MCLFEIDYKSTAVEISVVSYFCVYLGFGQLNHDFSSQTTRSRLQTALGAEARALENEKTASERLAASVAERDAAVDRARAVCEAHYTAMRRRLEVDWANERESIERISEERLGQAKFVIVFPHSVLRSSPL